MAAQYTEPSRVKALEASDAPRSPSASGYGAIPTRYRLRYVGNDGHQRWYRVRVLQYGNAGSAYIIVGGELVFLDTDTEHDLQAL